jgi:hypothetical protein
MPTLNAHGLGVTPPSGWDAEIYTRDLDPRIMTPQGVIEAVPPIAHIANFGLPPVRGDYGGGAVELMESGAVFVALLEHAPDEADTALFRGKGIPWPLAADDFDPNNLQRGIAGQSGIQRFFLVDGRPFCLYVVLGSHRLRATLVREVNAVLAGITFG